MNKYILIIILFVLAACGRHKQSNLELSAYTYDFGKIQKDSIYQGEIIIKNTGIDTLKIEKILADCGCTNAFSSKINIMPGDTSLVKFSFNSHNKFGNQENYITILANTDSLVHLLQVISIVTE